MCAILCFTATAKAQDGDAEALRHFQAGQRAQQAGSYDAAAQEFLKVIALMPNAAEAYASLGLAYNAESKYPESARALEKAQSLKPGLPGVSLYLGIDLVKLNRPAAAILELQKAQRQEPANKQPYLWLSAALNAAGRTPEAIDRLQVANGRFPSDPEILFRLGEAYRAQATAGTESIILAAAGKPMAHQVYGDIYKDQGLWLKAIGHYRRALGENSSWRGAHLGLGEVALLRKNLDEAQREFHRELEISPRSASADAGLAQIALLRGNPVEALALLDEAIHIAPAETSFALGLPPSRANTDASAGAGFLDKLRTCVPALADASPSPARSLALAYIHARLGDRTSFASSWNEFLGTAPNNMVAAHAYGRAESAFYRGDLTTAAGELRSWLRADPGDLQATYLLARTYRRLSLSILAELLTLAPNSYPAHQLLAETYENAEDDERAIAEYRIVGKTAPGLPGVHVALGRLLAKTGKPDEALTEFNDELRVNPDHAEANAEIGAIFVERGEQEKGIAFLAKAVRVEPDLWAAHRELGEAYYKQGRLELARTELLQAVEHDPEGQANYQLGRVYLALGSTADAKKAFVRSQEIKEDRIFDQSSPRSIPGESEP